MKKLLFALSVVCCLAAKAQVYNNEWIDYTKTYYKFKVGKTGLYRIPQSVLSAAGLGNTPAQNLQLWRNGIEVPVYTSVTSGTLSAADYIEFWGEMNDGKPDKPLYYNPDYQLNDKWSLETDTATYFLTVNTTTHLHLLPAANNVAGNKLAPEPYFMHTIGNYFKDRINGGYAVNVGEYMYSSAYDRGEGWSSNFIYTGNSYAATISNLYVYSGGPAPTFSIAASGGAVNPRSYKVTINNDSVAGGEVDFFEYARGASSFSLKTLASNTANIQILNQCTQPYDAMTVHQYELTYPRQFNFGGAANFEFSLPATTSGNYLTISGFQFGTTAPVLYDLTNGKRYVGDISAAPLVKIVLPPSTVDRKLVLVNEESTNINTITSLQSRNFIDYSVTANQGNYLIISNPILTNGSGTNPVEDYRAYRSSTTGGGYNAKVFLIDELTDQFAFGIKKDPLAIRNFIQFAQAKFSMPLKQIFLIGKGVNYVEQRGSETSPDMDKLNLVPTFGWPASDLLYTAAPGKSVPQIPIGRLPAIYPQEVALYLKKVKDYEQVQQTASPSIGDKAWMKNVVHLVGSNDPTLQSTLEDNMNKYKRMISDTSFGAKVYTFTKTSANEVQQLSNTQLQSLFAEGISLITYFGHSSSNALAFSLDKPENYNNPKKYPLFVALGCDAGDFYKFTTNRFQVKETVSETYVLAQDRGSIGFIASTHFGIVYYLDVFNTRFYRSLANTQYGKPIGTVLEAAIQQMLDSTSQDDFYARITSEQLALNGDPAIAINSQSKPDYAIEDAMVQVSPSVISVADASFKVAARFVNLGKAVNQKLVAQITRQYPNGTSEVVYRDTLPDKPNAYSVVPGGEYYSDSINVTLPIKELRDKGTNKITVTIDADNQIDELYETNNSITKEFVIYEDEARPVYPYNFSIVGKQNIKLSASTANAFSKSGQYSMEIDTTEAFNSSLKASGTATSSGGLLEFSPNITFKDSTVYYWRTGFVTANGQARWSPASSFIYLANHAAGSNQSQIYQQLKSTDNGIYVDSATGKFYYSLILNDILVKNTVYPTGGNAEQDFQMFINSPASYIGGGCYYNEIVFNVFDSVAFSPWKNSFSGGTGLYKSLVALCSSHREYNFDYSLATAADRKKAMDFIDAIPPGDFVIVRANVNPDSLGNTFAAAWQKDTALYGANNSLYHKLLKQGFTAIDSFNQLRTYIFAFKKDNPVAFTPQWIFSLGIHDKISLVLRPLTPGSSGTITSPIFGPAKAWKQYSWRGHSLDTLGGDDAKVSIIGIKKDGSQVPVLENITPNQLTVDVSSVDAAQYPYLQLKMINKDSLSHTPYQLNYWRLTYDPVPEGALAPNMYLNMKDTLQYGEKLDFKVAFKNVSNVPFDSVKVKVAVTGSNNISTTLSEKKYKPLLVNDTLQIAQPINTQALSGANTLYVEVNPADDQPEQYHFNNFGYKNFYVIKDSLNPLLDVTFDNTHILNHDIVSAKPDILIKLKDESKYLLLDDTALVNVQVRYPDGSLHPFRFTNDTLQFIPASGGANGNTATVRFKPYFAEDGDYELLVSGKDKSNNGAGTIEYRVGFQVINKAMISNMLNYPNPFTTSTAFVFTITGSEVPQNIKIQILTVTGKIVREITKEELGPLRIGRNITEFKWDGTDQYGQKLANGIYLYHVVTNLNGKSLDKYKAEGDNTDKYFNKGYGKMYLMR